MELKIGGEQVEREGMGGRGTIKSKAMWSEDKKSLVIVSERQFGDRGTFTSTDTYSLSKDGKTLTGFAPSLLPELSDWVLFASGNRQISACKIKEKAPNRDGASKQNALTRHSGPKSCKNSLSGFGFFTGLSTQSLNLGANVVRSDPRSAIGCFLKTGIFDFRLQIRRKTPNRETEPGNYGSPVR